MSLVPGRCSRGAAGTRGSVRRVRRPAVTLGLAVGGTYPPFGGGAGVGPRSAGWDLDDLDTSRSEPASNAPVSVASRSRSKTRKRRTRSSRSMSRFRPARPPVAAWFSHKASQRWPFIHASNAGHPRRAVTHVWGDQPRPSRRPTPAPGAFNAAAMLTVTHLSVTGRLRSDHVTPEHALR
jgi:hypothetical protein